MQVIFKLGGVHKLRRKDFANSDANFESNAIVKALLFRNSQMRRRPIFISDSKDTKEWPCFLCLFYFTHNICPTTYVRKRKKPICKVTCNNMSKIPTFLFHKRLPSLIPIKIFNFLWIVIAQQKQLLPRNLAQSINRV